MTLLALRVAGKSNAVSKLHAKKADQVWPGSQFEPVTNGVHIKTWDSIGQTPLTNAHKENKRRLLQLIAEQTKNQWDENHMLLGWARRMVPYKRPLALFEEIQQLKILINDAKMPIRIVISGIAPPGYDEADKVLHTLKTIIETELPGKAVYLPGYNSSLARLMTAGSDVWINTPVVGSEACGTSGMKAALNGSLPCSTKDGWIDEVDLSETGWVIDSDTVTQSLIKTLQKQIIPLYYENQSAWEQHMQKARALVKDHFSTTRMLQEYFEKLYLPIIKTSYAHYFS